MHSHCNRGGGGSYYPLSLELPSNRRETIINTISASEPQFIMKKNMAQKEGKAALRVENMNKEIGVEEKKSSTEPKATYLSCDW
ncbi:uncharacterized protein PAC_02494 [Phialocephala subalpina]|uniref:Uncharacterized protein n=1 Tax=Phialocephala subalpina TaxID=576137 RepID=A0A1L7WIM1_9HELO|nr:uncharacterized protein PAC_02494 [Phialocephala subalpina]